MINQVISKTSQVKISKSNMSEPFPTGMHAFAGFTNHYFGFVAFILEHILEVSTFEDCIILKRNFISLGPQTRSCIRLQQCR